MSLPHAILLTKGTRGDLVPFLAIGQSLRGAGWHITLLSHSGYRDAAASAEFDFVACDTPAEFSEFLNDGALLESPAGIETFARRHVLPRTEREMELIERLCDDGPAVLIQRHMSGFAVQTLAEAHSFPVVTVFTAVAQLTTRWLLQSVCRSRFAPEINAARKQAGLSPVSAWNAWMDKSDMHLACWPHWFAEAGKDQPRNLHHLGFLTADASESGALPPEVHAMLAASTPPVLITGGTARWTMASRFYSAAAEGCAAAGLSAILVTPFPDLAPARLPPGVRYFPRLPFGTLMPHVAAVIHHGGTSVLVRAMREGVPQLAMPFGADRPDTASRLARLGVARYLPPPAWTPANVAAAITQLLTDRRVRQACALLAGQVDRSNALGILPGILPHCTRIS